MTRRTDSLEETLCGALGQIRRTFAAALDDALGEPFVVMETQLRIDQVRGIFVTPAGMTIWDRKDSKHYISTARRGGVDYLGLIVGREAFMSADSFLILTADLCRGYMQFYATEYDIARFLNLIVAEPYHHPEHELPIWLTVAHLLATGRGQENVYAALPGLMTAHDLLHEEIPADAPPYAAKLRPSGTATIEQLTEELLAAVFPGLASRIAASTDEERSVLFTARASELKDYVRDTVLVRVGEVLAAT